MKIKKNQSFLIDIYLKVRKVRTELSNGAGEFLSKYIKDNNIDLSNSVLWISPLDVALRTKQFLNTIYRDKEDVLFVVTHGTTMKTIVMNFMHYSPEWYSRELTPGNCAIRLIDADGDQPTEKSICNDPYEKPKIKTLKKDQ